MSGTGAGQKKGRSGNRISQMADRPSIHGTADRMLGERVRDRRRLWRMPTFWVIVLIAFIALILMLLTSCGRVVPSQEVTASPKVSATDASPAQTGSADPSPGATIEPSSTGAAATDTPTTAPEGAGSGQSGEPGGAAALWPVPKGIVTEEGVRYGYADANGSFVIAPVFVQAHPFTAQGVALVEDSGDRQAVINRMGDFIIPWRRASIQNPESGPLLLSPYNENAGSEAWESAGTEVYDATGKRLFSEQGDVTLFSDGLALVFDQGPDGYAPIGYVNEQGTLQFNILAGDSRSFVDGLALVANNYGEPQYYIDKTGQDVTASVSDGWKVYRDEATGRFGYRHLDGRYLTDSLYLEAEPFRDGVAIVSVNPNMDEYQGLYGLIDNSGKWILEPMYSGIRRMRNGLFLVGEPLRTPAWSGYMPYMDFTDMALFSRKGDLLLDFILQGAVDADANRVSVTDGNRSWFVDASGRQDKTMADIETNGTFQIHGDLLIGTAGGFRCVYHTDGTLLAENRPALSLGDGVELTSALAEGNRYSQVIYPVLGGAPNLMIEGMINNRIKQTMGIGATSEPEVDEETGIRYVETLEGSWQAWRIGDMLVVEQYPYWYPLGAAHGSPSMLTLHFDLSTGNEMRLIDMFTAEKRAEALRFLSDRVTEIIQRDKEEIGYFVDSVAVTLDQPIRMTQEGLVLYWAPYELASYAAYFREFLVPWEDLRPYADKEGLAWQALKLP